MYVNFKLKNVYEMSDIRGDDISVNDISDASQYQNVIVFDYTERDFKLYIQFLNFETGMYLFLFILQYSTYFYLKHYA